MSRERHYTWRSARRTGRQLAVFVALAGIGFLLVVVSFLVFGPGA